MWGLAQRPLVRGRHLVARRRARLEPAELRLHQVELLILALDRLAEELLGLEQVLLELLEALLLVEQRLAVRLRRRLRVGAVRAHAVVRDDGGVGRCARNKCLETV